MLHHGNLSLHPGSGPYALPGSVSQYSLALRSVGLEPHTSGLLSGDVGGGTSRLVSSRKECCRGFF